ncbi:MAG: hypothetical protein ACRDP3_25695 [Streptomyces sp.]|uniref:hypothetical protein n=1 Tax=Streptomyces sp. TaxID=1931 RepID=UPI003D6A79DC
MPGDPEPEPPPTAARRTEYGSPPKAANGNSPDGWEANHAVLSRLAAHTVPWEPVGRAGRP